MMSEAPRVPFDPELEPGLAGLPPFFTTLDAARLSDFRRALAAPPPIEDVIAGRPVVATDHPVLAPDGAEITVSVLRRRDHVGT